MIISYSKNFVYIHLQKTGGTALTASVEPHLEPYDLVIRDWTKLIFNREGHALSEHATSRVVAEYLGDQWEGFNKVATVREPVSLMKSLYSYTSDVYEEHFRNTQEIPPDGTLKALRYAEQTGYGPDGFVDYLIMRDYVSVSPQSDRLGLMLEGTIVDLSRLSEDWGRIITAMRIPSTPLLKKNTSNSSSVEFSEATERKIMKHFEKDYDILPPLTGADWSSKIRNF